MYYSNRGEDPAKRGWNGGKGDETKVDELLLADSQAVSNNSALISGIIYELFWGIFPSQMTSSCPSR
jgi:hypothetical protein